MKTLEWTLGKSECAISGIMVWIHVCQWFILHGRDYVGIDTTWCGICI